MRRLVLVGLALALSNMTAQADDKANLGKVKTAWHAQDGETIDQIITKASKAAHFTPRDWDADDSSVTLSWVKRSNDKSGDEYTIYWEVGQDGNITMGPPYARTMELGWQAFALSLIVSEVVDGDREANLPFLHDPSNYNFVATAQGKLGDLLRRGRCAIVEPVGVDYLPKLTDKLDEKGDFWRIQLSVNCNIPGPRYFTHEGVIIFMKHGTEDWQPQSFFAKRIATYPPGAWFDRADPTEQETFDAARKVLHGQ